MANGTTSTLAALVNEGRQLRDASEPIVAHNAFRNWDDRVARWLDREHPDSGLSAQWSALPNSRLVVANHYRNDSDSWADRKLEAALRRTWFTTPKVGRCTLLETLHS